MHVEALKNIGGMSWIENPDQFQNFNIRRVQESFAPAFSAPETTITEATPEEDKESVDQSELEGEVN